MRELTSVKNPIIQSARALQTAKGRTEQRAFLLDGEHMVGEALSVCPQQVRTLLVDASRMERYQNMLSQAQTAGADVFAVPEHVLAAASQVKTPQGVSAICALPSPAELSEMGDKLLLLENVQDPGNVGTILRTLDAAGFDGCVLTPGCADPYAPKALRATMGSVFRVPVAFVQNVPDAAHVLCERGYELIGAALDGEPFYERSPLPRKLCVLIGNEGAGLSEAALESCTRRYRLPMRGGAESLNAGVAAAIFMYELMNH